MAFKTAIVWFRSDLRLEDNPALHHALTEGYRILPIYVQCPCEENGWSMGGASRWWLHHSLKSLNDSFQERESKLFFFKGRSLCTLLELTESYSIDAVFWNRCYEPTSIVRDKNIKEVMKSKGIEVKTFNASLLHEPWTIQNLSGLPFQVFTPFWKKALSITHPSPTIPAPLSTPSIPKPPASLPLESLQLLPKIRWDSEFYSHWKPGEKGAHQSIQKFLDNSFLAYKENRNFPTGQGTSRISPHLHFGEISPRQIWNLTAQTFSSDESWKNNQYITEIGWREFAYHLLFHFSHTPQEPLRKDFERFDWNPINPTSLEAWKKGQTGIPIVDAGMRELWKTGWMHNRVRMIVASFLVKNLRYPWIEGARWFWDTLVDADLASNTLGWQWSAGCGADAAPYFRIFNPVTQGEKFDSEGTYVRRWVPELKNMPSDWIHHPWDAPSEVLQKAHVTLGIHYPHPLVCLQKSRQEALAAFQKLKK